jgi:hypothetical protein
MGNYTSEAAKGDKHAHSLPTNLEAAAELYALSLLHGFSHFNRPEWLELLNEPHWSYWSDPHLANYHLVTRDAVRRMVPGVRVGGPCLPIAYFYGKQYDDFVGLRDFIDNTKGGLDFYSFHVYDFFGACCANPLRSRQGGLDRDDIIRASNRRIKRWPTTSRK